MAAETLFGPEPIVTGARYFGVIDGEEVPLTECDWIQVAPCGCINAVQVAQLTGSPHVVPDADAAAIGFTATETKVEAERDRKAGFVVKLVRHEDFRKMDFGGCTCEPKWGLTVTPIPDGYEWAAGSDYPRRSHYKHLVPSKAVMREGTPYPKADEDRDGRALCGSGNQWSLWRAEWWHLDRMECSRCIKAATVAVTP